jgi:hypothetical protein
MIALADEHLVAYHLSARRRLSAACSLVTQRLGSGHRAWEPIGDPWQRTKTGSLTASPHRTR